MFMISIAVIFHLGLLLGKSARFESFTQQCLFPEEKQTHLFWESLSVDTAEQQGQLQNRAGVLLLILQE